MSEQIWSRALQSSQSWGVITKFMSRILPTFARWILSRNDPFHYCACAIPFFCDKAGCINLVQRKGMTWPTWTLCSWPPLSLPSCHPGPSPGTRAAFRRSGAWNCSLSTWMRCGELSGALEVSSQGPRGVDTGCRTSQPPRE